MAARRMNKSKKRRNQIIAAARKLFGRQGFEETTMQQIVRAAGTSIGNCYFYFPNKEAVFVSVIQKINEDLITKARETLREYSDIADKIAAGCFLMINLTMKERLIFQYVAQQKVFLDYLFEDHLAVCKEAFSLRDSMDATEEEIVFTNILGSRERLLDQYIRGYIDTGPVELGYHFARWNLRAIGFPEKQVEETMARLRQAVAADRFDIEFEEKPRRYSGSAFVE